MNETTANTPPPPRSHNLDNPNSTASFRKVSANSCGLSSPLPDASSRAPCCTSSKDPLKQGPKLKAQKGQKTRQRQVWDEHPPRANIRKVKALGFRLLSALWLALLCTRFSLTAARFHYITHIKKTLQRSCSVEHTEVLNCRPLLPRNLQHETLTPVPLPGLLDEG